VLAKQAGADVFCVDIGVNGVVEHPKLLNYKVKKGTANMCKEAAMTREEALQAVLAGVEVVSSLGAKGYGLFATGEMGIGNTTASAAIAVVLGQVMPEQAVGRGTGIDDETLARKADVIRRALMLNEPNPQDPIDVLAKVGGLEIAGLVGVILGAAALHTPVLIDGFISTAAALIAARLCPAAVPYMIASHLSNEQGHRALLDQIGISPMIHLDMRLGEGTGAVLCFHFVEAALRLMREMATFESAGISKG
jgi:nicotinate-nucleotide--dimethylbenzimidazole phosphoribosyltransferase